MAIDSLSGLPSGGLLFGGAAGRFADRVVQDIAVDNSRGDIVATVEAKLKSRIAGATRADNVSLGLPDPGAVSTFAGGVQALGSSTLVAAQATNVGQREGVAGGATTTQASQLQAQTGSDSGNGRKVDVEV